MRLKDWRLKAVVQGTLSLLPGGRRVNDLLQVAFGERGNVAAHIDSKVEGDWLVHMANLDRLGFRVAGRHVMEMGTGWLPVMPLAFALGGAGRCTTFDLHRHLRPAAVGMALSHLERHLDRIAAAAGVARAEVADRWKAWSRLGDGLEILRAAGIEYRAPGDATRTGLPPASVGLVFSNSVLEHVPPPVIDAFMVESASILEPDGLAMHCVNCGDHYAYFDRSIDQTHYLRFSEREWRFWNNDLLYQNRLRPTDFLDSARRAGLEVVLARHRPRAELLARFSELPVAPEFRRYSPEDLCTTSIDFAARRARPGGAPR